MAAGERRPTTRRQVRGKGAEHHSTWHGADAGGSPLVTTRWPQFPRPSRSPPVLLCRTAGDAPPAVLPCASGLVPGWVSRVPGRLGGHISITSLADDLTECHSTEAA